MKYFKLTLIHKWYVFLAGLKIGNIPLWRLIIHDWSKFTFTEFVRYAKWHHGGIRDKAMWATAWHHHQRHNPHHPEHYILAWLGDPNFYDGIGKRTAAQFIIVLPMPETYIREMVADWMGTSMVNTSSWDMTEWLNDNLSRIILHDVTREQLNYILVNELGYDVVMEI